MRIRHLLRPLSLGAALLVTPLQAGCKSDDPGQVETVQLFARALLGKQPRKACGALVPERQDPMSCDAIVVPLLHYCPGFRGAKIRRRGPSSGWRYSKEVRVPLSYEGPEGKGAVDVTMRKVGGEWRLLLAMPVR